MNLNFDHLQKFLNNDFPNNPFNSLLDHRTTLLNSLKDELQYVNIESKLINYLFSLNSNLKSEESDTDDLDVFNQSSLLKFGSNEFYETQDNWRNSLNESFDVIKQSFKDNSEFKKFKHELDHAQDTMSKLHNTYFNTVQQRDNNLKLLLRLKMYTNNRLKLLEDSLKSYESMVEFKGMYGDPNTKLVPNNHNTSHSNKMEQEYKKVAKSTLLNEVKTMLKNNSVYLDTKNKPKSTKKNVSLVPVFRLPYSKNLLNVFTLTNSLDEFKSSAKIIYQRYGKNLMAFNVFNNVVLYLVQSLHLPILNKIPTDHIYNVYNVNQNSLLDFRTFSLLYWEVLHCIRKAVEIYYHPQYTFHSSNMYLNHSVDEQYPFVNILDYYSFIKRLSPGKSCNKYVAKEHDTNKLRVVELYLKTPELPLFREIYSEVEHFKKFNHKNLVKYIAVYHDYNTVYVVTEFCSELSLLNKLNNIDLNPFDYTLQFVHNVFTQVIEALVYLHCNNVTHKYLNLDKVMLDDSSPLPKIKLRDYGLMDVFENYKHHSDLTTLHYAPEVFDDTTTPKSDVWAAGVLLYFMLTGQMPSHNVNKSVFVDDASTNLTNSKLFYLDDDVVDLTTYMLSYDPTLRPTSFDVLSHPWFLATNLSDVPANTRLVSRYVNALVNLKNYRNITKLLESSNTFYVNKLNKLLNTLTLSSEPTQNELISYGNFLKVFKMENVPNSVISDLVQLTSLKDSDKCSLKELFVACKLWRFGELNIFWSLCKKSINENDWSFDKNEFVNLLNESKTSLMMKDEINSLCKSIELNGKVYWNHFVNFFL